MKCPPQVGEFLRSPTGTFFSTSNTDCLLPESWLGGVGIRVKDVSSTLERLRRLGVKPATRKLWVNTRAIRRLRKDPRMREVMKKDIRISNQQHNTAYIQDSNGIFICLYDHQEEPWGGPIPDHY